MRLFTVLAALCLLPALAWAVDTEDDEPATPTSTTTECSDGLIWDAASEACVAPADARLDDDIRYRAAREFAYVGQYEHALVALAAMTNPREDRVLTYLGFVNRVTGDVAKGFGYYHQALLRNPDNLLARSYMGQGFVQVGDLRAAQAQLEQIVARGGAGKWPAIALERAILAAK